MLNTVIGFNKCLLRMPVRWLAWLMALLAVNMIGPLFFIKHLEGQVVLGVFVLSAGLMMSLYAYKGFTRMLGAAHFPWFGLLPWLSSRHELVQPGEWLSYWIIGVIAINGLSLIIDAIDVARYMRGDRQPTISI